MVAVALKPGRRTWRMRRNAWILVVAACTLGSSAANADHDPNNTVTIYVHGFERAGADRHGVYGETIHEALMDSIASLAGLPVADSTNSPSPNAVSAISYYGDTPPAYYSAADVADIDQITAAWGGGVPRYAMIVAKYARHVLERSGARQVNFVSASFGSLIVRWLIEKDVAGLASQGKIARWLTAEGVLCGNWAASRDGLVGFLDFLDPLPIDVDHMNYDWVRTNLHAPRTEADNPLYGGILIGQFASTDDRYNDGALSGLMATYGEWQPNDGAQALGDARFQTVTAQSRLLGMPPTLDLFHVGHRSLDNHRGAWVQASAFLTQRRRVTVVMTSAQVTNLHEAHTIFWDARPAEVLFESRVYSPAAQARWGIADPLSTCEKDGAVAPLRRYNRDGDTQAFSHVIFDDFVLSDETQLRLELHAEEVDYDPWYGVVETAHTPYYDDLGSGTLMVSTLGPGTYTFQAPSWNCALSVTVTDYPFAPLVGVSDPVPSGGRGVLRISPNPFSSSVRVTLAGAPVPGVATLRIYDLSGRLVRRMTGGMGGFVWDGRDDQGVPLPAGVYLHRVSTLRQEWSGRSCLLR